MPLLPLPKEAFTSVYKESIFDHPLVDPVNAGVLLQPPQGHGAPLRLYYKFDILVQDGAAQKYCLSTKGDSGSKFCVKCSNVHSIASVITMEDEDAEAGVCLYDKKQDLVLASDSEVFASWDRLRDRQATESAADFALWQQACGMTFAEEALLSSVVLRSSWQPVTAYMHDYMHGMLQNGCLNIAGFLFMDAMHKMGLQSWNSFETYLGFWTLPSNGRKACPDLAGLFNKKRVEGHKKAQKLKMQASELLCVYPILAHYASTIGAKAENQLPVQAFLAVTLFMDMLLSIQHECVEAASLDTTAELILKLFKQNGWQAYLVKKFHWLFHYADSMLQHGFLIGTWAMERKHKQLTRIGSPIQNMQAYERSVLEEVVSAQMHQLRQPGIFDFSCRLMVRGKATGAMRQLLARHLGSLASTELYGSRTLMLHAGGSASSDDVVLFKHEAALCCGKLLWSFEAGSIYSIVRFFELAKTLPDSAIWEDSDLDDRVHVIPSTAILCAVTWSQSKCSYRTLLPYHVRCLVQKDTET